MNTKANNTNEKVRQLQRKLYQSAKKGRRRFHALYDKVYREDVLKQSMKKMKREVKSPLGARSVLAKVMEYLISELNPKLRGRTNYYGVKTAKKWLASMDWYVIRRYTIWYNKKHQKRNHLRNIALVRKSIYKKGLVKLSA